MEIGSLFLQIYFAILGAYLSVVMARILRQNGRALRKMDEGFTMMSAKMDEGFKMMSAKMDEGFKMMSTKMEEGFEMMITKMDEGFKMMITKMDEGFRRIDRGLELIARLIAEENERTRKEILDFLKEGGDTK